MAGPVLQTWAATNSGGSTTTSQLFNMPTGIAAGDLLICIVGSDDTATGDEFSTATSGWTKYTECGSATNTGDAHLGIFWKEAVGSDTAITVDAASADEMVGWVLRIDTADTTTPIYLDGGDDDQGVSTSHTLTDVTTTKVDTLAIYALIFDGADGTFGTPGGSWTKIDDELSGSAGTDVSGTFGTQAKGATGALGSPVISTGNDGICGLVFCIAPKTWNATATQALPSINQSGTATYSPKNVTSTATQALPSITQSMSGIVWDIGQISQTLPSINQSLTGTVYRIGSIAHTLPLVTQTLTGTYAPGTSTATATQALPAITQTGTATFAPGTSTATVIQTLPSVNQALSGAVHKIGQITQTLSAITQTLAGENPNQGSISQTLSAIAQSGTATFAPGTSTATGTSALKPVSQTLAGENLPPLFATITQTLNSINQSGLVRAIPSVHFRFLREDGTGWILREDGGYLLREDFTPYSSGSTYSLLQGINQALTGTVSNGVSGSATQTLPAVTQTLTGTYDPKDVTSSITQTLPAITQSLSGIVHDIGAIAQTLPPITQVMTGTFAPGTSTASITQALPAITQVMTGTFAPGTSTATATQTLSSLSQVLTGTFAPGTSTATATQTLPSITQVLTGTYDPKDVTSTITQTLQPINQVMAGEFSDEVQGAIISTLPSITQVMAGTFAPGTSTATITQSLPSINQSMSGKVHDIGTITQTFERIAYTTTGKFVEVEFPEWESYDKNEQWTGGNTSYFTFASFLRAPSTTLDQNGHIYGDSHIQIHLRNFDTFTNRFLIQLYDASDSGFFEFTLDKAIHGIEIGDWFAFMLSIDYSGSGVTPTVEIWTQKKGENTAYSISGGLNFDNDLGPKTFTFDTTSTHIGLDAGFNEGDFEISEVFVTNEFIDWSDAAERAKFVDNEGRPVGLGSDGSALTGTAAKIYLPDGDGTNNQGTGGDFTETGTISNSSTSPSDGAVNRMWLNQSMSANYWDNGGPITQTLPSINQVGIAEYWDNGGPILTNLPSINQVATGTFVPAKVGQGLQTLQPVSQVLTGTWDEGTDTGVGGSTLPSITQSISAWFFAGTTKGPLLTNLPFLNQTLTGTYGPGISTGAIENSLSGVTSTLAGTHQRGHFAVAEQTLSSINQSAAATFAPGTSTATGIQTLPAIIQTGTVTFAPGISRAEVFSNLKMVTQTMVGEVWEVGEIIQALPSVSQTLTGTFAPGTTTGAITQQLATVNQTLTGVKVKSGILTQALPAIGQILTGTWSVGGSVATIYQTLATTTQLGSAAAFSAGTKIGAINQTLQPVNQRMVAVTYKADPAPPLVWEQQNEELIWEQELDELIWY